MLRKEYAQSPFDGEGAYRFGGRWSSPGIRLCYTSEYQSLAMLEYFVHVDKDDPPADLVLAVADVPDEMSRERLSVAQLPSNWRDPAAPPELAEYGDRFVQRGESCLLLIPSVLCPGENNWLINPAHPQYKKVAIRGLEALDYDPRMFPRSRRHARRTR